MSTFILRLEAGASEGAAAGVGADAVGGTAGGPVGGTAGVTRVAVKDLIDMAGLPTTCGSRAIGTSAAPAAADASCLAGTRAAEAAGAAVIVGKTNLHELAFGVSGVNPWFGTPVNPLDPGRVPGGSSSGSAVAVAAGEADVAFGSDTGGSIRIPAACCGVVGLKTTRGRISLDGVRALAPSLDTVGPMGATVIATALGMQLLEPGFDWRRQPPVSRIGRVRLDAAEWIDRAIDDALASWASASSEGTREVVDVNLPGWEAAAEAVGVILVSEAWSVYRELWEKQAEDLSSDVSQRLEMGSMITPDEVAAAWENARRWAGELTRVLAEVDVLALPVLAEGPPVLQEAHRVGSIRHTAPFNLAGVPALAMPVGGGASAGAVPASLQLVAPAYGDELLLATGLALEDALGSPAGPAGQSSSSS